MTLKGTGKSTLYFGAKIYFAVFSDIFFSYPQNSAQQIFKKIMKIGAFNAILYIRCKQIIPEFSTFFEQRTFISVQGDLHIMLFSAGEFRENRSKERHNFYGCRLNYIYESTCCIKGLRFVHRHIPLSF